MFICRSVDELATLFMGHTRISDSISNIFCSHSKYPEIKIQTPVKPKEFMNAVLLIDNGITNNKQNTFLSLILHNLPTSSGGWPTST